VNLESVNALAQLLAAIGVIASLFYLAVQIRQNTLSMRAVAVDSLARALADINRPFEEDADLARGFARAVEDWHGASPEERSRVLFVLFAMFKLFENAWFQTQQGTLGPEQWEGWDALIRVYYHRAGVKTWWSMRRGAFAPGFRNYLEATQPVGHITPLSELIRGNP
jgi:hypothetical protein